MDDCFANHVHAAHSTTVSCVYQQLIRAKGADTMQPMVVSDDDIRSGFSSRLAACIAASPLAPPAGRSMRAWLATRYGVSQEAARKWLSGLAIPETTKLARIALDLGTSVEHLLTGRDDRGAQHDHAHLGVDENSLLVAYRSAPPFGKQMLSRVAEAASTTARNVHTLPSRGVEATGSRAEDSGINVEHLTFVIAQAMSLKGWTAARRATAIARVYAAITDDEKTPTKAVVLRLLRSA